ncbi:MAG: hypothetical protein ACI9BD_000897 [Candidatus Marinamargulisbacteria bacterium]|jgi:hypothetical protein
MYSRSDCMSLDTTALWHSLFGLSQLEKAQKKGEEAALIKPLNDLLDGYEKRSVLAKCSDDSTVYRKLQELNKIYFAFNDQWIQVTKEGYNDLRRPLSPTNIGPVNNEQRILSLPGLEQCTEQLLKVDKRRNAFSQTLKDSIQAVTEQIAKESLKADVSPVEGRETPKARSCFDIPVIFQIQIDWGQVWRKPSPIFAAIAPDFSGWRSASEFFSGLLPHSQVGAKDTIGNPISAPNLKLGQRPPHGTVVFPGTEL